MSAPSALMEVETISVPSIAEAASKRIDLPALDRAVDGLDFPEPGLLGRLLNLFDR